MELLGARLVAARIGLPDSPISTTNVLSGFMAGTMTGHVLDQAAVRTLPLRDSAPGRARIPHERAMKLPLAAEVDEKLSIGV